MSASTSQAGVQTTGSTISFTAAALAGSSGNTSFSYQWTQLAGPAVSLRSSTSAGTSFVAPTPGASYTFKVKVTDGAGWIASNQVSATSNTAPVLSPIPAKTVAQGGNLSFTSSATDAENNPVVFVASGLPAGASLDPATGVFTWNGASLPGDHAVTITPNDGAFSGTPQTVSITVAAPASSGGGGAMGWLDVFALLSLAGLGLSFGRQQGTRGKHP
ncbi:putative Ig domain-containing protein [Polaromonas sp. P2-4]|nr:putative Ig domain-containing protein [Polaromonas sp. P2-4]